MKKYIAIFKISWANELEYRVNFFLNRSKNIIYLLLLYYVWLNLSRLTGRFANYSAEELTTYVFGAHILRSVVFAAQLRLMAFEINDGSFSNYLVRPVSHLWFMFWRELAQRVIYIVTALVEIAVFVLITRAHFLVQTNWQTLAFLFTAVAGAIFLYFLLTYLVSLFAFWSREAMGPRFLFEWLLEFSSGSFFPLDILSAGLFFALQFLPFAYLVFFPMRIYLGKIGSTEAFEKILIQLVWIGIVSALTYLAWQRGLRKYSGEGI